MSTGEFKNKNKPFLSREVVPSLQKKRETFISQIHQKTKFDLTFRELYFGYSDNWAPDKWAPDNLAPVKLIDVG